MITSLVKEVLKGWSARTPTAAAVTGVLEGLAKGPSTKLVYDHMAFRTFGVNGFGIESIAKPFKDLHFVQRDALTFPDKKVNALWYSPPLTDEPLPRLFISELRVPELSPESQKIIQRYTRIGGGIEELNRAMKKAGIKMAASGGVTKVSADGGLLQSSTVADKVLFKFACGAEREVAAAYVEFAERKPLPEFADILEKELEEHQRREGFEQSKADLIFESTSDGAGELAEEDFTTARVLFNDSEENAAKPIQVYAR